MYMCSELPRQMSDGTKTDARSAQAGGFESSSRKSFETTRRDHKKWYNSDSLTHSAHHLVDLPEGGFNRWSHCRYDQDITVVTIARKWHINLITANLRLVTPFRLEVFPDSISTNVRSIWFTSR